MKFLLLSVSLLFLVSGCTLTKFHEDSKRTVYRPIYAPSGMKSEKEYRMGEVTNLEVGNSSEIIEIETDVENVVWLPAQNYMSNLSRTELPKPTTNISDNAQCDSRNGKQCRKGAFFDLFENLSDVPNGSIGKVRTCYVENDEKVYSCVQDGTQCASGKLGNYCWGEK